MIHPMSPVEIRMINFNYGHSMGIISRRLVETGFVKIGQDG
jgi:hypothetical protein